MVSTKECLTAVANLSKDGTMVPTTLEERIDVQVEQTTTQMRPYIKDEEEGVSIFEVMTYSGELAVSEELPKLVEEVSHEPLGPLSRLLGSG